LVSGFESSSSSAIAIAALESIWWISLGRNLRLQGDQEPMLRF
jgi:ssDNA-binding replication factor A large subunit